MGNKMPITNNTLLSFYRFSFLFSLMTLAIDVVGVRALSTTSLIYEKVSTGDLRRVNAFSSIHLSWGGTNS